MFSCRQIRYFDIDLIHAWADQAGIHATRSYSSPRVRLFADKTRPNFLLIPSKHFVLVPVA